MSRQRGGTDVLIDCDACAGRGTACGDCMVTLLFGSPPELAAAGAGEGTAATGDEAERRALAVLADSGLVSGLRLLPTGGARVRAVGSALAG